MSRKRNTDHDTAVAAAKDLFWQLGYAGAGTREIEERTGVTRFTLQNAYGGKKGFFLDTLDAYLDDAESGFFPDPEAFDIDALAAWFKRFADPEFMPRIGDNGCLALNSISAFDRDDAEINRRIERYLGSVEARFAAIIQRSIDIGDAQPDLDAGAMARVLVNLLLGIQVLVKARRNDSSPKAHADAVAALILSWKPGN